MDFFESSNSIKETQSVPVDAEAKKGLKEAPDLYQRVVRGGCWVMSIRVFSALIGFTKTFLFANLLLVQDLGILAVTAMLLDVLTVFFETGFNTKLIQEKEDVRPYLDTAWTINILRGLAMFFLLYFLAPLAASFKVPADKVSLTIGVIRGIGFCVLLDGLSNIGVLYFQRDLDFKKVFWLRIPPVVLDLVVSVGAVVFFKSVWGYVIGRLSEVLVRLLLSYFLSSYRPRLSVQWQKARGLWKFGKWVFGLSILNFLISEGDDFFVWGYLGLSSLALYRYAFRFSNLPATEITNTLSQVTFPAFSRIQDDVPRLRNAYLKVLTMTAFLSYPVAGLIFTLGPDFVRLFLKEDMHPMIPALQILAIKGAIRAIGSTRGPLFLAMGQPHIQWIFQGIRLVVLAVLIYPLTRMWGIAGTALATVLISVLLSPLGFFWICWGLQCSVWQLWSPSLIPLLSTLVTSAVVLGLRKTLFVSMTGGLFFGLCILWLLCYCGIACWLDWMNRFRLFRVLKEQYDVFRTRRDVS